MKLTDENQDYPDCMLRRRENKVRVPAAIQKLLEEREAASGKAGHHPNATSTCAIGVFAKEVVVQPAIDPFD